jgi:hypothetical protein
MLQNSLKKKLISPAMQKQKPCLLKNMSTTLKQTIFNRIEGNIGCFNDVIIINSNQKYENERDSKQVLESYNLIFFGGDVQV